MPLENGDALTILSICELYLVEQICLRTLVQDNLLQNGNYLVNILLHDIGVKVITELDRKIANNLSLRDLLLHIFLELDFTLLVDLILLDETLVPLAEVE